MNPKREFRDLAKMLCNGDSFIHAYTGYSFDYRGHSFFDVNARGEYVRLPSRMLTSECFALAGLLDATELFVRCKELINDGLYLDDTCWSLWTETRKQYKELMDAWLPAQRK